MTFPTEDRTIRGLVMRIDEVRAARVLAKDLEKTLGDRESLLRKDLLDYMVAAEERIANVNGIAVVVKSIRKVEVTDLEALRQATVKAGRVHDYLQFDKATAAKDALAFDWPGVELTYTPQLSVGRPGGES